MEKIVPARYDEGWGTWHGKWYGADDEVIISGYVSPLESNRLCIDISSEPTSVARILQIDKIDISISDPIPACYLISHH